MKNKKGRPPKAEAEKSVVVAVSLQPDLAAFARELGDGSATRGVQKALIDVRKRRKAKPHAKP